MGSESSKVGMALALGCGVKLGSSRVWGVIWCVQWGRLWWWRVE